MINETAATTAGNVVQQQQYNWDNIEVGDFHLDHSGNFFEQRRQREKIEKENDRNGFNVKTITHDLEHIFLKSINSPSITHLRTTTKNQQHQNLSTPSRANQPNNKMSLNTESSNLSSPINRPVTRAAMKQRNVQQINPSTQSVNVQQQPPPPPPLPATAPSSSSSTSRPKPRNAVAVVSTKSVLPATKQFSVVKYEELYRKKKEQTMKRLAAEDKLNRQFKPNPVPNFAAAHRQMDKKLLKIPKPQICYPETPQTLKNSLKAREIRDKKIAEQLKSKVEPFVAVEAKVLEQNPYKPHLDHRHIIAEPFPLRMLDRLADRREYDKKYEQECKQKRQMEIMRKEKEDQEIAKQFREQTKFKARPNPFH